MTIQFNADEIFEIAVQIERNGCKFYRECSEIVTNQEIKELLKSFAEAEEKHEMIFKTMHENFKATDSYIVSEDADDVRLNYLQTVASGYVFNITPGSVKPDITIDEILKFALEREKDSVVYYVSMKELVKDEKGKKSIEKIISEEIEHVTFITHQIQRYCKN